MGIELGDETNKQRKTRIFLTNNAPRVRLDSLGKCPACKKGKIKKMKRHLVCSDCLNGLQICFMEKRNDEFLWEIFGV